MSCALEDPVAPPQPSLPVSPPSRRIDAKDAEKFIELAAQENLTATKVATVTDDRRMKMLHQIVALFNHGRSGFIQEQPLKLSFRQGVAFLDFCAACLYRFFVVCFRRPCRTAAAVPASFIATVTDDRRMKMLHRGKAIVDVSRDFLDTNGVKQVTDAEINEKVTDFFESHAYSNFPPLLIVPKTHKEFLQRKTDIFHFSAACNNLGNRRNYRIYCARKRRRPKDRNNIPDFNALKELYNTVNSAIFWGQIKFATVTEKGGAAAV